MDGENAAGPAVVAATARFDAVVVTRDPRDISALAGTGDPRVAVLDPKG